MNKLRSISAFFPAYNDAGTIGEVVTSALDTLRELADEYEVIVINDGSRDHTARVLDELARAYPEEVRVVHHATNRGYGGALRSGFAHATKEWVFYTDGDAQYDVRELAKLVPLAHEADLVNGWKIRRRDPLHRIVIGAVYRRAIKLLFGLNLRDVDADFRLIRRTVFDVVSLSADSGVICVELMKKVQDAGFRLRETGVHHFPRVYGRSEFFRLHSVLRTLRDLCLLWVRLVVRAEHRSPQRVTPELEHGA